MELKEKIDALATGFEEFKKANEASLKEIAAKGAASADTEAKLAKIEADLQKKEGEIELLTKALNRTGGMGGGSAEETAGASDKKAQAKYQDELKRFMRKGVDVSAESQEWARKSMSVDSDSDGGFLVSPEMSSEIVKKVFESTPMRELASVQTISTDSLEILEDLDEAASGWVGETEARAETNTPSLKKIVIPVHELYAQPKATQKLLDDASINVEQWLAGKVTEKFSRDEALSFISGNGVKKPKGILAYDSGTGFNQIERVATAANNAIVANELVDLQSALKEQYQGNSTWLMNRLIIGAIRKLKDQYGQYMWQPGLSVGQPGTLLGRPVRMAGDMSSTVAASTDLLVYGDIKAGYQIVDRIGIRVLRDPFTAKPYILFYTTKRVGGGVKNFEAIKVLRTIA